MPGWPTPDVARRAVPLTAGLLLLGVALAPTAMAADDPARPGYAVVSGPSCHPGGVEVRVVAGTVPYSVVLATTRQPDGEDRADLAPGETVLLHTGDVAYGETIDSRLVFTARDGSGAGFTDELETYTFTRPAEKDCAAIAPSLAQVTASPATVPASSGGPSPVDLPVRPAASSQSVAPVNRPPDWALIAAGASLAGAAGGLVLVSSRRRDTPRA